MNVPVYYLRFKSNFVPQLRAFLLAILGSFEKAFSIWTRVYNITRHLMMDEEHTVQMVLHAEVTTSFAAQNGENWIWAALGILAQSQ